MSNETEHQLIPNTYTICDSTEQCKELFELAKKLGITSINSEHEDGDIVIASCHDNWMDGGIGVWTCEEMNLEYIFIPLPDFISRLQGKWQPNEVSEPDYQALYEAEKAKNEKLTQGVKDAKAEMGKRAELNAAEKYNQHCQSLADAYDSASEILTEKTGI